MNSELKNLQGLWAKAKAPAPKEKKAVYRLPPGTYSAKVTETEVYTKEGVLKVRWDFKILAGAEKGHTAKRWDTLKTDNNMAYFKADLEKIGLEVPKKIEELEVTMDKAKNREIEIFCKHNGDWTNIYLNKLLNDGLGDVEEDVEDFDDDEDWD